MQWLNCVDPKKKLNTALDSNAGVKEILDFTQCQYLIFEEKKNPLNPWLSQHSVNKPDPVRNRLKLTACVRCHFN